jgi:hypothetical protein
MYRLTLGTEYKAPGVGLPRFARRSGIELSAIRFVSAAAPARQKTDSVGGIREG